MKDREKRRDLTLRAQARAYKDRKDRYDRHLQFWGGRKSLFIGVPHWLGEPHRFAKNGQGACDCRHKHHGRPKVGKGTCQRSEGKYRDDVRARITWRHTVGTLIPWLRAGFDPLDFEG